MSESSLLQIQDLEIDNLKKINLAVDVRDVIALIGKPASGKNTLLKCINLTLKPSKGSVSFNNKDLVILGKRELRENIKQMAYVEANPYFIESKTVFENISLVCQIQDPSDNLHTSKVQDLLKLVGLLGKQDNFPSELTVIQKIKLDIARNLTTTPTILLLEDFTTGSDLKSIKQLEQLLTKLNREMGLTIVLCTNDASTIKEICNQVIIMENGVIVEKTSVVDLFFNPISETAREYVKFITKSEIPLIIRNNLTNARQKDSSILLRITMSNEKNSQETLFRTLDSMELSLSIVQAYQDKIQNQQFNVVLANLIADEDTTKTFLKILQDNNIYSEVIGYVNTVF